MILITALLASAMQSASAEELNTAEIRVGRLGRPIASLEGHWGEQSVDWTAASLEKLKAVGFNAVEVRYGHPTEQGVHDRLPATAAEKAEFKRRLLLAKEQGLRIVVGFSSPLTDRYPQTGRVSGNPYRFDGVTFESWYDILDPKVRAYELLTLKKLRDENPEIDDVLVYSYDAGAWQTPEFQYTKYSYGIPIASKLAGFLADLHRIWTDGRRGHVLWWEPWELSAGQIYEILPELPRSDLGLMIHSNIGETQLAAPVDTWFRNVARICCERGIPVVVEGFFESANEEIDPLVVPVPRLVDEEYLAFKRVPGIAGISEYMYGVLPDVADLNRDMLQARMHDPHASTEALLQNITRRFGPAQSEVVTYLGLLSDAYQVFPWDASWGARWMGLSNPDHGWSAAIVRGPTAPTPVWYSTNRGHFMSSNYEQPHFWMLEDVGLRSNLAADLFARANAGVPEMLRKLTAPPDKAMFQRIHHDVDALRAIARSYYLHTRETNVAQMLHQDLEAGRPLTPALLQEMESLLDMDVKNQGGTRSSVGNSSAFCG